MIALFASFMFGPDCLCVDNWWSGIDDEQFVGDQECYYDQDLYLHDQKDQQEQLD